MHEPWAAGSRDSSKEMESPTGGVLVIAHCPKGSLEMKPALQIPYFLGKVRPEG